eukprot:scaffold1375_cov255-Pinguiococcus_pyrenoidosus.AAC.7
MASERVLSCLRGGSCPSDRSAACPPFKKFKNLSRQSSRLRESCASVRTPKTTVRCSGGALWPSAPLPGSA